jgi:hypothetical protein
VPVVVYALSDLDTIMILPVLLAVATVTDRRGRCTAAAATHRHPMIAAPAGPDGVAAAA